MSLMQLWRCLYAVKKKNDSTDMVPFRESKLTHILMPTLYRVGTSGASMIACVNPQSADYDESISVLGNASLACEINVKETLPVEKVARPALRKTASRSSVTAPSTHRSSVSSTNSGSVASSTVSSSSSAAPTSSSTATVQKEKDSRKRKATTTVTEGSESTTKATKSSKATKSHSDEIEVLQKEITSLKAQNKELIDAQMGREQEIREEVCGEMAKYSQNLLDQIQELQDEIYELKTVNVDPKKSVKKAKREQRTLEHEESIRNLADSEEEMERQKKYYDAEIKELKQQIRAANIEIAEWKMQATANSANSENENSAQKKLLKRKPLGTISPNVSPTQEASDLCMKAKKDKRSTSPYRETDGSGHPGIAPPASPKLVGSGPFFTRTMRSTTVRI